MRFHFKPVSVLYFSILLGAFAPTVKGGQVYNLAQDWSDTSNPNGVWTYLAAPGIPLTSHLSDWDPTRSAFTSPQPVWAYGTYPNFGQIPLFTKVVSTFLDTDNDAPIGSVLIHDNDPSNSPNGLEYQPAGFAWTAPSAGTINISGSMWEVQRYLGRSEDWMLEVNGVTVSSGELTSSSSITSSTPLNLATGTGGIAALTQNVTAGEVISLMFIRAPGEPYGTFMGVNLTIDLNAVPEPSTFVLGIIGLAMAGGRYAVRRRRVEAETQLLEDCR
jgi:hypothetical protein